LKREICTPRLIFFQAMNKNKLQAQSGNIHFAVEIASLHAHLFRVTLIVTKPSQCQRLSLPVWIPGSYLVREFSKNLHNLRAHQGRRELVASQIDKCSWSVACDVAKPLVVTYDIYALDNSVRTAWLDAARGFFNGTSMFLRVEGQTDMPHSVEIVAPSGIKNWSIATALAAVSVSKEGFGSYRADHYDELVDCPVEMGAFWSGTFKAGGITHRFVVAGAPPTFDGARLLADTQKICEAEIKFWHGANKSKPPFKNYLFMLNAVDDGYGGLEHRSSTALICNRKDLPRLVSSAPAANGKAADALHSKLSEGYTTLLGLISHEYFHTWNVKRLRPAEFAQYDYAAENYTQLLWFFEGFTSYYDDLLLRRAGLIDDATYLKLLTKTINQVLQTPGRKVQSVAQASFDAWIKYYRQDENTPNATVSYYTKGSLVALCLDLTLRSEGKTTLDAVMRALWLRCKAGPMTEADLLAVLKALTGRSYATELAVWVHSTDDMPLETLLLGTGVGVLHEPSQLAQALGLRVAEGTAVQVKTVLRGGAAEAAGFAAGDEWLGIEVSAALGTAKPRNQKAASATTGWRINKLDDVVLYAGAHAQVNALVARDKRLLTLTLTLPKAETTWRLVAREPKLVAGWLGG
jgi:predicted metalloprotease with PDZ domain